MVAAPVAHHKVWTDPPLAALDGVVDRRLGPLSKSRRSFREIGLILQVYFVQGSRSCTVVMAAS
jgi:hypothetical protein